MIEATEYYFQKLATNEEDGFVDVTRKDDRARENILSGMLRNMSDEWFVNEATMYQVDSREELTPEEVNDILDWVERNVSRRYLVVKGDKWVSRVDNVRPVGQMMTSHITMRFRSLDEAILFRMKWG